jgi:hypothetical protein
MDMGREQLEEDAERYEAEARAAEEAGQGRRSRQLWESARASRRLSREKGGQGADADGAVRRWLRRFGGS